MSNTPEILKGRDIAAPTESVTFNGQRYAMKFNNRAARIAEDIYADKFGRDVGYYTIIAEVTVPRHSAIMAMVYAGITAAGAQIDWDEFDENFRLTDIDGVKEAINRGVVRSLPDEDPDEDDEKNPEATPTEA